MQKKAVQDKQAIDSFVQVNLHIQQDDKTFTVFDGNGKLLSLFVNMLH